MDGITPQEGERRLEAHLRTWLGAWPEGGPDGLLVVGSDARTRPAWDGGVRPVNGVVTPCGAVISVPPDRIDEVRALGDDLDLLGAGIGEAVGRPGWMFARGVFRWTHAPSRLDDLGVWLDRQDERVPEWLRPFNGEVLVALVDGAVAAGVGRKLHDAHGHELAVVTEEAHRGKGLAAALVTQAARRVIREGAVPTYLHAPDNHASAATAVRCGFPDEGWEIVGLFGSSPG